MSEREKPKTITVPVADQPTAVTTITVPSEGPSTPFRTSGASGSLSNLHGHRIRRFPSNLDGWEIEETLEEGHGANSSRKYFYRGRLATRTELTTPVARRLAGLTLIEKDLRSMQAWTAALREALVSLGASAEKTVSGLMPTDVAPEARSSIMVARGLYLALVTTYGKLFTEAEGRRVNLSRKDHVDAEHRAIHDYVIETRNQFAAHGGVGLEGCCVVRTVVVNDDGREVSDTFTELHQPTFIGLPEIARVEALLAQLQARVLESHERCSKTLRGEGTR